MKKLFLLDAYALIYRAYFAFIRAPRINSKGLNTSAILGFVNTLEDVLKREQPTHIAVAFDPAGPTFRHEAFEAYKAQREQTPEDIKTAVPIIKDLLKAYNIPIYEVMGYEADDVIGTLAKQAATQGFEVYMLTPDKDYGQLVEDHIYMYRPRHNGGYEVMGVPEVLAKYGLSSQSQVIDLLGLMGDSSDNIPGCPGVGEKTAVKLLQEFGSIEGLLANTHALKGALKTKIENNVEQIKFSRFLATIKTDVPIALNEEDLLRKEPNAEALRGLFTELEFRKLLRNDESMNRGKLRVSESRSNVYIDYAEREQLHEGVARVIVESYTIKRERSEQINDSSIKREQSEQNHRITNKHETHHYTRRWHGRRAHSRIRR